MTLEFHNCIQEKKINFIYKSIVYSKKTVIDLLIAGAAGAIIWSMLHINAYIRDIKNSSCKQEMLLVQQNILLLKQLENKKNGR